MDKFISFVSSSVLWTVILAIISISIISYIFYFMFGKLFDKYTTKCIYLRIAGITIIVICFVSLFGLVNIPAWVGIMTVYSFIFYIVSENFLGKFFGIKNKNNGSKIMNINALLLLSIPLLYVSLAFVNEESIKNSIGINDFYLETKLKEIETKVEKNTDKTENLVYTKSGFVKKCERDKETKEVFPLKNIYVNYKGENWIIEKVIDASNVENPVVLLSQTNHSSFKKFFMIGLFRIVFIEFEIVGLALLCGAVFSLIGQTQRDKIKKNIHTYLGGDSDLLQLQGTWYRIQQYPIDQSNYIESFHTFSISGNELRLSEKNFEIINKSSKLSIKLEKNNKKIKCNQDGTLEIDGYTFVQKNSEKWKELYKSINKIEKNKTYFISENYKFLGMDIDISEDPIYYSDDKNLFENRSKNPNSYNIVEGIPITDDTQILEVEITDSSNLASKIRKRIEVSKFDSKKFILKK